MATQSISQLLATPKEITVERKVYVVKQYLRYLRAEHGHYVSRRGFALSLSGIAILTSGVVGGRAMWGVAASLEAIEAFYQESLTHDWVNTNY